MSFRYKVHKDTTPQFGLIAEDVEEVNPDLVIYDADGQPYTVRYDAVNTMLLTEFLKEHRKVEALKKDFQASVAQLTAQLKEQAAQIQKVTAQLQPANRCSVEFAITLKAHKPQLLTLLRLRFCMV